MSARRAASALLLCLAAGGCPGGKGTAGGSGPAGAAPAIPAIEITTDDPEILAQVAAASAALAEAPEEAEANGRMGMLYELYQRPAAALACYERAARFAPRTFRWHYHLARLHHVLGENDAALADLERALEIDARYVPALALRGELLLEGGDDTRAEQAFRAALAVRPRSCAGLLGLGRTLASRGDHQGALQLYLQALDVAPDHAPLHYAAGLSRRALGETDMARKHFDYAAQSGEANPDPDPELAALYRLEVGVERDYREAKRLLNAHEYEPAIPLLRQVVAKAPDRVEAIGALGKALVLTRRHDEALATYELALAKNPTNIDFLRPYSTELATKGRLPEAEEAMRKVFDLGGGNHPDDHHVLGLILYNQGRFAEAIPCFERALEMKPDHAEARAALARARAGR